MAQCVLILIKPDGMIKGLAGVVVSRLSLLGLSLVGVKLVSVSRSLAEEHYRHLREEPFYPKLIDLFTGKIHGTNHVLAMVYRGPAAVARCRELAGATNPELAEKTSIRGSLGRVTTDGIMENVIHVSSDPEEAEREIKLWFSPQELQEEIYPIKKIEQTISQPIWA